MKAWTKEVYPVFIKKNKRHFLAYVPDFDLYTQGKNFYDAVLMARDAMGAAGVALEDEGTDMPVPMSEKDAKKAAKKNADKNFDFSTGILTHVDIDFETYRARMNNRSVRKNCTIPYWMSIEGDKLAVNYSKVLQDGLIGILGAKVG